MNRDLSNLIKGLVAGVVLASGVSYIFADWSPPTSAPTGGNVAAPVNVSNSAQIKGGGLTVNANNINATGLYVPFGDFRIDRGSMTLGAGKAKASSFCNAGGSACFTAEEVRALLDSR